MTDNEAIEVLALQDEAALPTIPKGNLIIPWVKLFCVLVIKFATRRFLSSKYVLAKLLDKILYDNASIILIGMRSRRKEQVIRILSTMRMIIGFISVDDLIIKINETKLSVRFKKGLINFISYFLNNFKALDVLTPILAINRGEAHDVLADGTLLPIRMGHKDLAAVISCPPNTVIPIEL